MIKRLSVFFIAMLLICNTAFAENNSLSFSFCIQRESSDSSVSFDADLSDHSIRIRFRRSRPPAASRPSPVCSPASHSGRTPAQR